MKNIVTLDDVCKVKASKIIQKSLINLKGIYPVYGATGFIKNVDFYEQDEEYIAIVKDGAGIGKTMLLPKKSSILSTMQYILPKENIDIKYLYYAISYMDLRKYFTGATIPHIYFKDYKKEKLSLPNKQEQRNIVSKLISIDKLIELKKQQIIILNKLVSSLFIELFGSQVDNPYNFEKGIIKDVVNEVKYGTSSPANDNGIYPYLRMGNITYDGQLDLTNLKYITINDKELDKYIVKKGDVLFNRTNSKELVGKTCVFNLDEPMIIAGYIIRVRTNNRVIPEYLSAVLNSKYGKQTLFDMCKSIVGQANINAQELQKIKLLIPPIEIQLKYKSYLVQIDKSKLAIQQSLEKLEILKKSLMQEYFG